MIVTMVDIATQAKKLLWLIEKMIITIVDIARQEKSILKWH